MKNWKGLAIYPKVIDQKPISEFSDAEKNHLTRKGFRWYVYYSYRNPETDKFDRKIAPTLNLNRNHSSFNKRHKAFRRLKQSVKEMLKDGYSPFDVSVIDGEVMTIDKAMDYALSNKKLKIGKATYKNYCFRIEQLKVFLKKRNLLNRDVATFNFRVIRDFLKSLAKSSSMANRNNSLRVLKAVFSDLYENDVIRENYVAKIKIEKTPSKEKRFKSYSHKQAVEILEHLDQNDEVMALFVKFISYNFLRPKEVVRLKVGDIDMENKLLSVFVKQGYSKAKRIPDAIISDLTKFDLSNKNNLLFSREKIGVGWTREINGRRQYYSKRYARIKKSLGYGKGYTLYSFRHTYITIGYKNLRKRLSKDDALDTLMGYTGHETRDAMAKYIHHHDADVVDPYQGEVK